MWHGKTWDHFFRTRQGQKKAYGQRTERENTRRMSGSYVLIAMAQACIQYRYWNLSSVWACGIQGVHQGRVIAGIEQKEFYSSYTQLIAYK